jgi:predicted ATPase
LTELVGREEELELLLRRWSKAKSGQGQVVLLSGEAGIGKSRLTAALLERLATEPHTRLRYFCSPQHTDARFIRSSARWNVPPWVGRAYVTFLGINRLAERDISAMIDRVVGNKSLPANIRQDIIERADGIPLFVEEMTKAVLEAESEGAAERAIGLVPSPVLAVPASLHAPLMARLDRLGPPKEIGQIGATIGREFSHALLAAVLHKPEAKLQSALDRLIAVGLLFRQGVPPHATYRRANRRWTGQPRP